MKITLLLVVILLKRTFCTILIFDLWFSKSDILKSLCVFKISSILFEFYQLMKPVPSLVLATKGKKRRLEAT